MIKKTLSILAISLLLALTPSQNQEKTVKITLTVNQWEVVLKGLGELPLKESGSISQSIIMQAQQQLQDTLPKKK